ncbi:MAG: FAD-dependent oxidoreductase [Atopobiaceae bacterium]|jgi:2-enoate reductase|nr:FAD-dependent oxidoreductase [Atopobiaceae bacterium]MCH4180133.1 FAD-dependent oxidoreductase [Atopobiaceae bacterium]MCH4213815.1 FAD-dependent oxidoreductase [Atopobiaceae bacterium]MCH4229917.1 FAD-dependent oxidoreductase [Atopobiaceae bacterium]MCH4275722.1 FAD-dependent oxidoreductase [Atopobiaceae bacterium]
MSKHGSKHDHDHTSKHDHAGKHDHARDASPAPHDRSKLFEPIRIGSLTVKNRISMAPLGMVCMSDSRGGFTQRAQDYYVERARGGTGLVMSGVTLANYDEMHDFSVPCAAYDPVWFAKTTHEMIGRIHAFDSVMFLQISAGFGRVVIPPMAKRFYAPSDQENRWDPSIHQQGMTADEIHKLIRDMVACAASAQHAGFDGVEVHAVHEGYLLDQFAIGLYNERGDEYGGSLENRLRPAIEIVQGIHAACGDDYPVSLRYSLKSFVKAIRHGALPGEDFDEKGKDLEEGLEAAHILEQAGYDMFNVDAGTYDSWYWNHPPMYFQKGMYREFARAMKENGIKAPIICAGRMDDPDMAADSIGRDCDLIGLGRPLLADPDWANKVKVGDEADIRPCLSCQQGCLARLAEGQPLSCAVNPACGRERDFALTPTATPRKVLVVGGGVAGMEAARALAIRGHKVTLWEKSDHLGGNVCVGSAPDFKSDDRALVAWYTRQLDKLPVDVHLGQEATRKNILAAHADVVVVASGATPIQVDLGGKGLPVLADDVLTGKVTPGNRVCIVGGGLVGCETALWLAEQGHEVAIVEATSQILGGGEGMCFANYDMLKDELAFHHVTLYESSTASEVKEASVVVSTPGGNHEIPADTTLLAVGYRADTRLYDELSREDVITYDIGDSRHVHNIMGAIWDAYQLAMEL